MEKGQLPPWKIGQTLHRFMIRLCFICSYRNISTLINKLEQTIEFEKNPRYFIANSTLFNL